MVPFTELGKTEDKNIWRWKLRVLLGTCELHRDGVDYLRGERVL